MNRFSLLDSDNEDETPVQKAPKKEKEEKKPATKAAPAPAPAAAAPVAKKDAPASKKEAAPSTKKDDSKASKDPSASKAKDGEKKPKKEGPAPASPVPGAETDVQKVDSRGGRQGRGDRRERGGRGGRGRGDSNPDGSDVKNDRKSHFHADRSGGRGPRREGGGRFNTGSAAADARDAEKNPSAALTEGAGEGEDKDGEAEGPATEDAPEEVAPAEPVVPEETFEQFMAKRNEARANAQLFGTASTRAVEEVAIGVKKTDVKPEDVNSFIDGQIKAKVAKKGEQRSLTKTQVVDVAFQVEASLPPPPADDREYGSRGRGRGGRGDSRGEGRGGGGRGRGGGSSPRSGGARVDFSNAELFPSL